MAGMLVIVLTTQTSQTTTAMWISTVMIPAIPTILMGVLIQAMAIAMVTPPVIHILRVATFGKVTMETNVLHKSTIVISLTSNA
jgi:hypothetical protein